MSCQDCEISYLQDKTSMLERVVRLIVNRLHESNTSAGTTYAQQQSVATITAFEEAWDKAVCTHVVADVSDFGAKGDAVTDDTTAIQSAIDSKRGPGRPKKV